MIKKVVLLVFTLALLLSNSNASHVMGGHFEVTQYSGSSYQIDFFGYLDCQNGYPGFSFSPNKVRVYETGTNNFITFINISNLSNIRSVPLGDSCYYPGLCVEEWHYSSFITLLPNSNGYYLTYDICCRNSIINNIIYPNFNGHTFYAQIPPSSIPLGNSSPRFKPYNNDAYFCIQKTKCYDLSASDIDGDSLVYSIIKPLDEDSTGRPFDSIVWQNTYNTNNPLGPGGFMTIDSKTGILCAQSPTLGVFVFSILVEEYRNGVKIGEVVNDFQWESLNCSVGTNISYPAKNDTIFLSLAKNCFDIVTKDSTATNDTLAMTITANIKNSNHYLNLPNPTQIQPSNLYEFNYTDSLTGLPTTLNINSWQNSNTFYGVGIVGGRFCIAPNDCLLYNREDMELNVETHSLRCVGSDSLRTRINVKYVISDVNTIVPNVFSPNGDNKNDSYQLNGLYHKCFDVLNIKIYNRWGLKVFESNDPDFKWDGINRNTGEKLSEGAYYVVLNGFYGVQNVTNRFPIHLFR